MGEPFVQYHLPGQTAANQAVIQSAAQTLAKKTAKEYAKYNAAGGVSALTLLDSDIEFGVTNEANTYTPASAFSGYPNTIKVTLRRDKKANGPLSLFFGGILGVKATSLTATAAATLYSANVSSFKISSTNTAVLPMAYDVNHWNEFVKTGKGPDGTELQDADGNAALQIYPSIKYSGNFGQVSLSGSHVGDSTEIDWVKSGVPSGDIRTLLDRRLIPLSGHPDQWDWTGGTGIKASLINTTNRQAGKTYLLPLFKPKDANPLTYQPGEGKGSSFQFNIVGFVGVRILPTTDIDGAILVTPSPVPEPNAIFDASTIAPAGTTTTFVTTLVPPRLTQ